MLGLWEAARRRCATEFQLEYPRAYRRHGISLNRLVLRYLLHVADREPFLINLCCDGGGRSAAGQPSAVSFHLPQDTNARLPLPGAAGFAIRCLRVYPCLMPSKPIELPPEIARAFVRDMRAFFAVGGTGVKADEIAIRQLLILNEYLGRRERPLQVIDVKEMFLQMRDQA